MFTCYADILRRPSCLVLKEERTSHLNYAPGYADIKSFMTEASSQSSVAYYTVE